MMTRSPSTQLVIVQPARARCGLPDRCDSHTSDLQLTYSVTLAAGMSDTGSQRLCLCNLYAWWLTRLLMGLLQVQKGQVSAKRQPSMTDRMLVGQRLNSKEIHDEDVRR